MIALYTKSLLTNSKTFADMTSEQTAEVSAGARIYEVVGMFRKLAAAAVVAALFDSPTIQLASAAGINALFVVYAVICNPYGTLYKIFDIVS